MKKFIVLLSTFFALSIGVSSQSYADGQSASQPSIEASSFNLDIIKRIRDRFSRDRYRKTAPKRIAPVDEKLKRAKFSSELKKDLKRKADGKKAKVRKGKNSRIADRTAGLYDEKQKENLRKRFKEKNNSSDREI